MGLNISGSKEANIGTRVIAINHDARSANVTVNASSLKICPAIPTTKIIGRKTAIVVKVEPVIAPTTSSLPSADASLRVPFFKDTDSSTTIAASTNIPTPNARPPKDMVLRLILTNDIRKNTAIMETGMAIEILIAGHILPKNRNKTINASMPPFMASFFTPETELLINTD